MNERDIWNTFYVLHIFPPCTSIFFLFQLAIFSLVRTHIMMACASKMLKELNIKYNSLIAHCIYIILFFCAKKNERHEMTGTRPDV